MTLHPLAVTPFEHRSDVVHGVLDIPFGQLDAPRIHQIALDQIPFVSGAITGVPGSIGVDRVRMAWSFLHSQGRKGAANWTRQYRYAGSGLAADESDYVPIDFTVTSFDMPIAWLTDRYWVVVTHFCSQVTRRHQEVTRGLVNLHAPLRQVRTS